jgi:hypothetical protein
LFWFFFSIFAETAALGFLGFDFPRAEEDFLAADLDLVSTFGPLD